LRGALGQPSRGDGGAQPGLGPLAVKQAQEIGSRSVEAAGEVLQAGHGIGGNWFVRRWCVLAPTDGPAGLKARQ
jgi:hypothetical protein